MSEGTQFPSSEMRRHEDDAAAAAQGFEIIFKSIMDDELRNVILVQFRKMGELHEKPSQIPETPA